jgi:hypothetical protein
VEQKEIIKKDLPCKLSREETLTLSKELAKLQEDGVGLAERKKDVVADFNSRLESVKAESLRLSRMINNGYEYREVECSWSLDLKEGTKDLVRHDTGEIVQTKRLTEEDREQKLL